MFCTSLSAAATDVAAPFQLWATTNGNDAIRVVPVEARINPDGCTDADSYMVKKTLSEASKARIYSALLAAKMGARGVTLQIEGCESARPAIVDVVIK